MEYGMIMGIVGKVEVEHALSWINSIVNNTMPLVILGKEAVAEILIDEAVGDKEKGVLRK